MERSPLRWQKGRLPLILMAWILFLPSSCKKHKTGPTDVYEHWSRAVLAHDCGRIYRLLDEKSRWAVMSAARDTAKAAAIIQKSYPENRKAEELSKLGVQVADGKPEAYFESICRRHHYPRLLAPTAGKITAITVVGDKAHVVTDKKTRVLLTRDQYGRWGCTALKDQVVRRQLVAANFLKIVEQNAKVFHGAAAHGTSPETK